MAGRSLGMTRPLESCTVYLGTRDGLSIATLDGESLTVVGQVAPGNVVRDSSVHPEDPSDVFVGCGLRGWGLYHTPDAGRTVRNLGFDDQWVWGVTRHPSDPETVYVGTEPPMLYRSSDGGESFEPLDGVTAVPSRDQWTFFHEPFYEGHVHGISIHPDRPETIYAGVEHGAVLVSTDGGETWAETLVGSDVHRIAHHPTDPDHVLVATGAGLHQRFEPGGPWRQTDALRGKYLHSIEFVSTDQWVVYADHRESPVYRTEDGGDSWDAVGEGLPSARPADTLCVHPTAAETLLYAGDDGQEWSHVYVSTDLGESWQKLNERVPKVWRMAVGAAIAT